jgi:hypothetical protein
VNILAETPSILTHTHTHLCMCFRFFLASLYFFAVYVRELWGRERKEKGGCKMYTSTQLI